MCRVANPSGGSGLGAVPPGLDTALFRDAEPQKVPPRNHMGIPSTGASCDVFLRSLKTVSLFGWVAWVAFGAWFLAAPARAQEPQQQSVELKYEVDPELQDCPNVAEFRSIVTQQLGYDPTVHGAALEVQVRVRATESGLEGTIDWSTADADKLGERRFTSRGEDCREMMKTVGFVVAVQIQLMATQRANAAAQRPDSEPSADSKQQPPNLSLGSPPSVTLTVRSFGVRPVPMASHKWSVMAGLGPSIGVGLGPNLVGEGRLFLGLQTAWFGLEAGVEASVPSTTREAYGGGFRHELFLGTLGACGYRDSIAACAVGKLGQIRANGTGIDKPASPSGLLAQVGPRLVYSLGLGKHLVLLGRVEGLYLLTPWTVDLNHLDVWTMPRLGVVSGIDVAGRFR